MGHKIISAARSLESTLSPPYLVIDSSRNPIDKPHNK